MTPDRVMFELGRLDARVERLERDTADLNRRLRACLKAAKAKRAEVPA